LYIVSVLQSVDGCAGTILGQEMYKLVIMDTLIHVIGYQV